MLGTELLESPLLTTPTPAETATGYADVLWAWLIGSGLRILLILVVAALASAFVNGILRRFVKSMIDSSTKLSTATGIAVGRDKKARRTAQARRAQRAETLANAARNVARIVIWAVALVMILSELGVDIAPVIASLGVIGLAAGIGAQTIIKDIVAGFVMLFEDIVAVGDFVDLEYASGTVVDINLRVTQLRSIDGVLWTVRNGEIVRVGNMSRGFGTAVVLLDIDASADNARVTEVLERIGAELSEDEEWSDRLQGPVQITGILTVDGARFQRRMTVKSAPGEQWGVEQELRRRVRAAFRAEGIDFALPRFTEATSA